MNGTKFLFALDLILFLLLVVSISFIFKKEEVKSVSSSNFVVDQLTACANPSTYTQRKQCLKVAAEDIVQNVKLEDFSKAIRESESKQEVFNNCHEVSHYIGRLEYQKSRNIGNVFSRCEHICLDGCYHGAVEGYFIEKDITLSTENHDKVSGEVAKICGKREDYNVPELYVSCLHGLGHAVMFITDNELLEALDLCDALTGTEELELCYTGVFMANSDSRTNSDHPSKYIKNEDPMYPCTILLPRHQKKCYEYNTFNFYYFTNFDWAKVIELCGVVPKDYRRGCYETMGGDQVGFTHDMVKIKEACAEIKTEEFLAACITGAEGNLVMRYSSDFIKPIEFCKLWEGRLRDSCFDTFITLLNRWSRDSRKKVTVCQKIEEEAYRDKCLEKINKKYLPGDT